MLNIDELLKAMENMYEEDEVTFEWTKSLCDLQKTCTTHEVGMKNLKLQRYTCPVCKKILNKTPKLLN